MTGSPWLAALYGALAGAAAGLASRLALRRVIASSDAVFYSVFVTGIFVRLGLLIAAVWLLRRENHIIVVLFAAGMVLVQMLFEVFPIKHGPKADS